MPRSALRRAGPTALLALTVLGAAAFGQAPAAEDIPEDHLRALDCPAWIEETYRIGDLIDQLDLDLEERVSTIRACVEHDVRLMKPVIPFGWCDNILKVHCSALDVLTEIGELLIERCERQLGESPGLSVEQHEAWKTCGADAVFDRYANDGVVTEGTACREALIEECGAEVNGDLATEESESPAAAVDRSAARAAQAAATWPQWGGPARDFHAPAGSLAATWPESGPPALWRRELGDGYSAIVFEAGRLYTMYRAGEKEVVVCLDAATSATLWEHRYDQPLPAKHLPQWGDGPNATPLVVGDRLFTVGVAGRMLALNKGDGSVLWTRELWGEDLGGSVRSNGYSSSPVAWQGSVIVPVGAENAGVVAFDQADGRILWKSVGSKNSYSSPSILTIAGEPQLLSFMADELLALDPGTGELLWRYAHGNQWGQNINVPVVASGDVVFLSSPQAGSRGLEIRRAGDRFEVEELWSNRRVQLYHVTSVQDGDWVYGSTGTNSPAFMVAVDIRTGEVAWRERGFAKANCVEADGRLVILDEDGVLALATATPEALETHARARILEPVAWTTPTIVGTTLYARDRRQVVALDLGSGTAKPD